MCPFQRGGRRPKSPLGVGRARSVPAIRDSFGNHHSITCCMTQQIMELGELSSAKLSVTLMDTIIKAKTEQLKRVKLYLAVRKMRKQPMGWADGLWTKPTPKT